VLSSVQLLTCHVVGISWMGTFRMVFVIYRPLPALLLQVKHGGFVHVRAKKFPRSPAARILISATSKFQVPSSSEKRRTDTVTVALLALKKLSFDKLPERGRTGWIIEQVSSTHLNRACFCDV
jgi:hypothetical protein